MGIGSRDQAEPREYVRPAYLVSNLISCPAASGASPRAEGLGETLKAKFRKDPGGAVGRANGHQWLTHVPQP